ncbi:hypothetical protein [Chitinophaga sancti]|nr:hypothetical protein [Chitinophaga sancti]WQD63970.1 hypothetical protein U0033_06140 [Chitinophaga sancti]WQG90405.1 hypothetical protein SR876_02780 [Chitinophaga sancti]
MLKPTSKQYNQQIYEWLENVKKNTVIAFSEAHLDDLRNSEIVLRDQDLEFMEKYVGKLYMRYDYVNKKSVFEIATPLEAFQAQNYEIYDQALRAPLDVRASIADMDDFPEKRILLNTIDHYLKLPISGISDAIYGSPYSINKVKATNAPTVKLDELLVGNEYAMYSLISDSGKFSELRKNATETLNTANYNYRNWGAAFNDKLEQSPIGKKFTDILRSLVTEQNKEDYLYHFRFAYSVLELLGVTTEKAGKKRKKNSLLDLSGDSFHAFFAMNCDFFITNDRGLYEKSKILYDIFQVNATKVLYASDFEELPISKYSEASFSELIELLRSLDTPTGENEKAVWHELKLPFLHYFDTVVQERNTVDKWMLYCNKDFNRTFVYDEIIFIYNKIFNALPGDEKGEPLTLDRLSKLQDPVRNVWEYPSAEIEICIDPMILGMSLTIRLL